MFKYNNKNYRKVKYSYFKLERQFNLIDANILYMLKFYHIKLLALLFWFTFLSIGSTTFRDLTFVIKN